MVDHPQLFVTLTAPSFGPVHRTRRVGERRSTRAGLGAAPGSARTGARSRARCATTKTTLPSASRCAPSASTTAGRCCGTPMCSRLWGRTCHRLYREVAQAGGLSTPAAALGGPALLHQGGRVPGPRARPPPRRPPSRRRGRAVRARRRPGSTPRCSADAIGRVVAEVGVAGARARRDGPAAGPLGRPARRPGAHRRATTTDATAIAAYVAKYATKTADGTPWLAHRIRLGPRSSAWRSAPTSWPWSGRPGRSGHARNLAAPAPARPRPHPRLPRPVLLQERRASRPPSPRCARPGPTTSAGRREPTSTTTASGATPAGATPTPRPTPWPPRLLEARLEVPSQFPRVPGRVPRRVPKRHDQGERAKRILGSGRFGEPFGERVREPDVARWRHDTNHQSLNQLARSSHWPTTSPPGRAVPRQRVWPRRIAVPTPTGRGAPDLAALLARRDADGRPAIRIQERLAKEAPGDPLAALALLSMLRGRPRGRARPARAQRSGQRPRRRGRHAGRRLGGGDQAPAARSLGAQRRHLEPGPPGQRDAPGVARSSRAAARGLRPGRRARTRSPTGPGGSGRCWPPPWPPACSPRDRSS